MSRFLLLSAVFVSAYCGGAYFVNESKFSKQEEKDFNAMPSLFLTPEQLEKASRRKPLQQDFPAEISNQKMRTRKPLKVEGIMMSSQTKEWIIWINGKKITSESDDKSIDGWSIESVTDREVIIFSPGGERQVLGLEQ
ncbi:hypothetical protein [Candidatus Hydrogenosomobacter endosymbioticus]|uniref:Type II secretion system protein GspC N-terminal domain-containing protein n=1 Tax=Candidatus Hydrogenosomobacter endosymbioticus TaxID=2558174 RepID=A0ABM7V9E2_9PROT|nr:hypothetical protein [Candidatus Hydrogenosomobacter endosymbioticus]BDB96414.1 hypothetical protein HYD_5470 [Candidatus Hydrogenosomobacter endosymbioticus]